MKSRLAMKRELFEAIFSRDPLTWVVIGGITLACLLLLWIW